MVICAPNPVEVTDPGHSRVQKSHSDNVRVWGKGSLGHSSLDAGSDAMSILTAHPTCWEFHEISSCDGLRHTAGTSVHPVSLGWLDDRS